MLRNLADIVSQGHKPKVNLKDGTFGPASASNSFLCTTGASSAPGLKFLSASKHTYCALSTDAKSKIPDGTDLSEVILLDCGCDQSTFADSDLIVNAVNIEPKRIQGVGQAVATKMGESIFGDVLIVPDQDINLLSQSQLIDDQKFSVQYNAQKDSYLVYNDLQNFEFTRLGGLYAIHVKDVTVQAAVNEMKAAQHPHAMALTTDGEDLLLPIHARQRLMEARRLHVVLGHPSEAVLSKAVDHDLANTRLTSADVRNMERVLGPCPECVQGKARHRTEGGTYAPATLPGEILHLDLIPYAVGNKQSLTAIVAVDQLSMYGVVGDTVSKTSGILIKRVMDIVNFFKSKGAYTRTIRTDPENAFRALIPLLAAEGITLDTRPVGQHEKFAESRIASLRDRMRAIEASMPYALPYTLSIFLLKEANRLLNMVPSVRTGNSSPYTIIHERRPEAPKLAFGETVLVTDPAPHTPTNNRDVRADLALYIGQSDTSSASGHFLMLATRTIKQRGLSTAKITPHGPHVD